MTDTFKSGWTLPTELLKRIASDPRVIAESAEDWEGIEAVVLAYRDIVEPPAAPLTPQCPGGDLCDGDLPGEWHEKSCPCYQEEVDGVAAAEWEKRKPEMQAEFNAWEESRASNSAAPVETPRWIPAEELPKRDGDFVVARFGEKGSRLGFYIVGLKFFSLESGWRAADGMTHWFDTDWIPAPPSEPEWVKCLQCGRENSKETWAKRNGKCPNCDSLHDREVGEVTRLAHDSDLMASIDKAMVDVAENRMLTLEEFAKAVDEKTEERLRNELKEWKALGADSPSAMATILSAGAEGGRTYASMLERLREENEQLRNAIKEQAKTESGIVKQFRQRAEKAESETESLRAQMESWRDNCEHLANCSEPYPKCEQCASLRLYFRGSNSAS